MAIKTCSSSDTEQDSTLVTGILPMIHYVFKDVNQGTTIFMDEGSNTLLITTTLANALYLQGKVKLTTVLKACNKVSQAVSHIHHEVELEDHQGKKYRINCIKVPFITKIQDLPNLKKIYEMFPSIPKGCLKKPNMEVGILLGQNANALLPTGGTGEHQIGHLRVRRTIFFSQKPELPRLMG